MMVDWVLGYARACIHACDLAWTELMYSIHACDLAWTGLMYTRLAFVWIMGCKMCGMERAFVCTMRMLRIIRVWEWMPC